MWKKRGGMASALGSLLLVMTACGGGGGGGSGTAAPLPSGTSGAQDDAIKVQYEKTPSGFYIDSNNYPAPSGMEVKARLDREPTGTVHAVIVDSQQVLETQWAKPTVTRLPDGSYSAWLTPKWQSTPGVYSGSLQLHLCKDAQCQAEYPLIGGDLAYRFEFVPDITVTAARNGAPASASNGVSSAKSAQSLIIQAGIGDAVEVFANMPVTWQVVSAGTSRALVVGSQSDRQITGIVGPGDLGGAIEVRATPIDSRFKYGSTVMFTVF